MKNKFCKVLALILSAALLCVLLVGCGDETKIQKDPAGYLKTAMENTQKDLAKRYSGSPIAAMNDAVDSDSTSTDFSLSVIGGEAMEELSSALELSGTFSADTETNEYLLDLAVSVSGVSVSAQVYAEPEFVGISCPFLLGDDTVYGVRPYNLYEQAEGSLFDSSTGSDYGMDISSLKEVDELIDTFRNNDGKSVEESIEQLIADVQDILDSSEYTYEKSSDGKGYIISTTLDGEKVAQIVETVTDAMLDNSLISSMTDFSVNNGEAESIEEALEDIENTLEDMRNSDKTVTITYLVEDEKLISVSISDDDTDTGRTITVNYYDGDSVTLTYEGEEGTISLNSEASTDSKLYSHIITVNMDMNGEYASETIQTNYDLDSGDLSTIINIDADGDTMSIAFGGTLTTDKDGFDFSNGAISIDEDGSNVIALSLDLSVSSAKEPAFPEDTKNIFELTESEFLAAVMNIYTALQ
jgi:hypothetical protein